MKKILLSFVSMNFTFVMFAQIQNANLDSWTNSEPNGWILSASGSGTNNYLTGYGEVLNIYL